MNRRLTVIVASAVLSASITGFMSPAFAEVAVTTSLGTNSSVPISEQTASRLSPAQTVQPIAAVYPLTDVLNVQIKSVLTEEILGGTRIGIVIKMENTSTSITKVPDYEVRARTSKGITYTLQPSTANPRVIQPQTTTDISYMVVLDRAEKITISEVNWTDVDYYVYPKKETLMASVPITIQPWHGVDTSMTDSAAIRKWSDAFRIPALDSPIEYTPVDIHKESTKTGNVYVVQLLAYNPSSQRETVPDFAIDGKNDKKVFIGSRLEKDTIQLDAKEEKYMHYAIPTDQDTELLSLNLLTAESFTSGASNVVSYQVGRLNILLPGDAAPQNYEAYALGTSMKFDMRSELIHPDLQVSLVELHMNDNQDEGSKQVTAKFRLYNQSARPLAIPMFQTELIGSGGYQYSGRRQVLAATSVLPNTGTTINYTYVVPATETGTGLALKLQDTTAQAPYKSTIAAYSVNLQAPDKEDKFSLYPFNVAIERWDISFLFNSATHQYTYKGKFSFDIERIKETQVDESFPQLQFELHDSLGRLVGTSVKSLIGQERLVTGENNIAFTGNSEQFDTPLTLKVYEIFKTENGDAKRLLTELSRS
ncbi:hypothetical protein OB236_39380 [Paenibacillus sp. WQ 127069]|uniref:DUF4139 domain-containing protein n=1 Tax=Paenibacillus baimaensis TaxID=2982185 RepID=A0ABT2UWL0_9BACL|nr:hypothetical protein [Paenibacillus sp. WQ 127069]MCU6798207.1 hypothetical protein [Paenibacillus sp. WQ 127069]